MATQMEFIETQIKNLEAVQKVRETENDFSNWRLCSDEEIKGRIAELKNLRDMIKANAFEKEPSPLGNDLTLLGAVYIPDNDFGLTERYYNVNQLVELLRTFKANPEVVQFIADMMEI